MTSRTSCTPGELCSYPESGEVLCRTKKSTEVLLMRKKKVDKKNKSIVFKSVSG